MGDTRKADAWNVARGRINTFEVPDGLAGSAFELASLVEQLLNYWYNYLRFGFERTEQATSVLQLENALLIRHLNLSV